ncbi:plasmid replication DNA-binding protein [Acinetobacter nectaris]|uniref:plasmid replication DNA-binding protein n=1 Tax=Acinetobacter nectaris TaxID=1219382 RepID=UPI001F41238C|nr:plasmid replication DNA-binding protein [Acinetobacter nectaris]MCF9047424.1 DNA-binding protein [Acinetobacter nectaris]
MNIATKCSVSDAATLYKKSRATIYKDIKNSILSRDHDGFIDFSELLRVYGEPLSGKHKKRIDTFPTQNLNTPKYEDNTVSELKNQIDFLKKQLEKAEDRESKANSRIDTLLTLIEMKPVPNTLSDPQSEIPKSEQPNQNQHISVAEQKKRGFISRFFLPND